MKIVLSSILTCFYLLCFAQKNSGISFQKADWSEIVRIAKEQKKAIFVDCYASWCGPCKKMDREIYIKDSIGQFVNENYVSVKIQFDSTKRDDEFVRMLYGTAQEFKQKYKVSAFPTFLFFSSDGEILHKDLGYKSAIEFTALLRNSLLPKNQIYTQIKEFKKGLAEMTSLPELANKIRNVLADNELADMIDEHYSTNYLEKLRDDKLLERSNIEFIVYKPHLLKSNGRYFKMFLNNGREVDEIMGQNGYSKKIIDFVIFQEEILPLLYSNNKVLNNPDWNKLNKNIKEKYGKELASRNMINAKIWFFNKRGDKENEIKYQVIKIERFGLDTSTWGRFSANNMIYDLIFKHSSEKKVLRKAISYMEVILSIEGDDASSIDTYANLLYKIGRKKEAIKLQEKAANLNVYNKEIKEHLAKMKSDLPTWN